LDDIGVHYFKEGPQTVVGPFFAKQKFEGYSFDCLVEHGGKKLYIECHGEYWHGPTREAKDRAKATFLKTYVPEAELLVLWEFEFRSPERIRQIIQEKLGVVSQQLVRFAFDEMVISESDVTDDIKALFAKYHYLANIGRFGSIRYVARLNGELAACVVFSHPTRQESRTRLGLRAGELFELTRFCIHPKFQARNFATWFMARVMKQLWQAKPDIKKILTFVDTTHGHIGTIYRAGNWQFDGEVKPDYWYVDANHCWYHKKTVWDHAVKFGASERDYAAAHNLRRINGQKKLRFIMNRPQGGAGQK
jgi:hypothetical protein